MIEREGDAGPGLAGGATAHRVHDDHERSRGRLDGLIDRVGRPQFLDTQAGQFLAHGRHEIFGVGHVLFSLPQRGVIRSQPTMTLSDQSGIVVSAALGSVASFAGTKPLSAQAPRVARRRPRLPPPRAPGPGTAASRRAAPRHVRPAGPPERGTGIVRGRVVALDTGLPLRRARVMLRSRRGQPRAATTDADGAFSFAGLPAGRYSLSGSKARYVDTSLRRPRGPAAPGSRWTWPTARRSTASSWRCRPPASSPDACSTTPARSSTGAEVMPMRFRTINGERQLGAERADRGRRTTPAPSASTAWRPARTYLSARDEESRPLSWRGRRPRRHRLRAHVLPRHRGGERGAADRGRRPAPRSWPTCSSSPRACTTVTGIVVDAAGAPATGGHMMVAGSAAGGGRFRSGGIGSSIKPDGTFMVSGLAPGEYTHRGAAVIR